MIDIREFDVTYHMRVSIDTEIRCGKWYTVHNIDNRCILENFGEIEVSDVYLLSLASFLTVNYGLILCSNPTRTEYHEQVHGITTHPVSSSFLSL